MLSKFFSSVDLFGIPVVINFSGKAKLRSSFGGICTLLCLGLIILVFYNASQEMFSQTNPKTTSSETFSNEPRDMILTEGNFPVAFGLLAPMALDFKPFVNEAIFTIKASYDTIDTVKLPDGTSQTLRSSIPVDLERCTLSHFGEFAFAFDNLDMSTLYCVAKEQRQLERLLLKGAATSARYQIFNVEVYQCDSTTLTTCAGEPELHEYLEGAYFNTVYANMVIDLNNKTHPDARYQDIYSKSLSRTLYKITNLQLSHVQVITDSGWVTEKTHTEEFVQIGRVLENSQTRVITAINAPLMTTTFEVSKLENIYTRSYKKILTVLAEVSSLANTILMVVLLVIFPYLRLRFRETLMNQLFEVDMKANERAKGKRRLGMKQINVIAGQGLYADRFKSTIGISNKNKDEPSSGPRSSTEQDLDMIRNFGVSAGISNSIKRKTEIFFASTEDGMQKNPNSKKTLKSLTSPQNRQFPHEKSHKYEHRKVSSERDVSIEEVNRDRERRASPPNNEDRNVRPTHRRMGQKEESIKLEMKVLEETNECPDQCQSQVFSDVFQSVQVQKDRGVELQEIAELDESPKTIDQQKYHEMLKLRIKHLNTIEREDPSIDSEEQRIIRNLNKKSDFVKLKVWEYFLSFFYKTKTIKNKFEILKVGTKNIGERMDVINILKKVREIDKMRAMFFDHDQLLLFDNLPKPEISLQETKIYAEGHKPEAFEVLNDIKVNNRPATEQELIAAYKRLKNKPQKTVLDDRLLSVFNETFI